MAHKDYVRSGQVSTSNPHLVLTGSYDATVRLFDARSGQCEMVMGGGSGGHVGSAPVEQVLMFPSGTVALSSAGPILRVWDIIAGGRCLRALSNHQKTITALALGSNAGRVLTGGLDHMVKVYDVGTYKVVHTIRYPAPILSLAISVGAVYFPLCYGTKSPVARRHAYCHWHVRWYTVCEASTAQIIRNSFQRALVTPFWCIRVVPWKLLT